MEAFKSEVLNTLYTQQQSTAHILRERMSKITAGAVSTLVVIDGWLIASSEKLETPQVLMLILSIIIITGVAVYGVRARYQEFCAVARLIVRIETAMKIYEHGAFIENEPLYPEVHNDLGTKDYEHGMNIFLSQAYILLVFGLLSVLLGAIGLMR